MNAFKIFLGNNLQRTERSWWIEGALGGIKHYYIN